MSVVDTLDQIVPYLGDNLHILIIAGLGIAGGIFIYRLMYERESFEMTSLQERTHDSLEDVLNALGNTLNTKLRYRLDIKGVVYKGYEISVYRKEQQKNDEGELETQKVKEAWEIMNVRPQFKILNPFNYAFWFMFDRIAGLGWFSNLFLVPKDKLTRHDQIEIHKDVDFTRMAGIFIPRNDGGTEVVQDEAMISVLEDSLERFSNMVEFMNFLDRKFSKDVQNMEKYYELEASKWGSREDSVVEGG